jgi:hypothetical protein
MTNLMRIPPAENWKFGPALPPALLREMASADTWHMDEFARRFSSLSLYKVPAPEWESDMKEG